MSLVEKLKEKTLKVFQKDLSTQILVTHVGADYLTIPESVWWRLIREDVGREVLEKKDTLDIVVNEDIWIKNLIRHHYDTVIKKQIKTTVYDVKADEKLFTRVGLCEYQCTEILALIRSIQCIVQNDQEITEEQLKDWYFLVNQQAKSISNYIGDHIPKIIEEVKNYVEESKKA